jgi:serine/threonine protein kinase/tetratricopeptide (TPR) repeat protein
VAREQRDEGSGLRDLFDANAPDERLEPEDHSALAKVEAELFGRPQKPLTLSRYVLRQRLGAGGAGVVYEAYDPELDRKVAIKLLNTQRTNLAQVAEARVRLVREARAMAKLSHPNVIPVYDVGTYDEGDLSPEAAEPLGQDNGEGVFLVMELVEGKTLSDWLETKPHWRDVLARFVAAGRGLAAAHDAGLIHRDFKLDNVLLGADGRVRVLDFGLARAQWVEHPVTQESPAGQVGVDPSGMDATVDLATHQRRDLAPDEASISPQALSSQLTLAGTVLGTPNYMAPEQHSAGPSDERTDQYSFCVALHMALYGQRPFEADTFEALGEAKRAGKVRPAPPDSEVPKPLFEIVARGLSPDPAARHPSMESLLAKLALDPFAGRKRVVVGGFLVGALALVGAGAIAWQAHEETACDGYERELEVLWSDEARQQMQQSFSATQLTFATATYDSTTRILDEYAQAWVDQRTQACKIERDPGQEPREMTQRRVACLDERLRELGATTKVLLEADATITEHAVAVAAGLESPTTCGELERLVTGTTHDSDLAGREEVETLLARARALSMARQGGESQNVAEQAVTAARGYGLERLEAKALLQLGKSQRNLPPEEVVATFRQALTLSERLGDDETASQVMIQLIYALGWSASKKEEANWFADLAKARMEHQPLGGLHASQLAAHTAVLRFAEGRFDEALELNLEALALTEEVVGSDHPRVASMHHAVGNRLRALERFEEARGRYERALEVRERHLGPHHPSVSYELEGIATVAIDLGDFEAAEANLQRSLEVLVGAYGEDSPRTGFTHLGLGALYRQQGRDAEGLTHFERALHSLEKSRGPKHLATIEAHMGIGGCLTGLGRLAQAREALENGLKLVEEAAGQEHPSTADMSALLADVLLRQGEFDRAIELAGRAVEIHAALHGEAHRSTVDTQFTLARAIVEKDPARAQQLAKKAQAFYASKLPEDRGRKEIDAWLAEHSETRGSQ